jgi:hypothetical protein
LNLARALIHAAMKRTNEAPETGRYHDGEMAVRRRYKASNLH